jgi:aryl-alcohol dehydrogenase-like predicted oxidoreductase
MQMHALGKTGLSIAPIVFGGNVFGGRSMKRLHSIFSMPSSMPVSTPSTRRTSIPPGCPATSAEPAQIALAWLMQKKGVTAPIASAANLYQLESLTKSTSLKLSHEAMGLLDKAGA